MSHLGNTTILERHFEDASELTRLELITELGRSAKSLLEAGRHRRMDFDQLATAVAYKRFEEGPDGPC